MNFRYTILHMTIGGVQYAKYTITLRPRKMRKTSRCGEIMFEDLQTKKKKEIQTYEIDEI